MIPLTSNLEVIEEEGQRVGEGGRREEEGGEGEGGEGEGGEGEGGEGEGGV
jgi:hypothetical protein